MLVFFCYLSIEGLSYLSHVLLMLFVHITNIGIELRLYCRFVRFRNSDLYGHILWSIPYNRAKMTIKFIELNNYIVEQSLHLALLLIRPFHGIFIAKTSFDDIIFIFFQISIILFQYCNHFF